MINPEHPLPVVRQWELLNVARSTAYYRPLPMSEADLTLMRRLDELHLKWPFLGARKLRDLLNQDGFDVGRKHVVTLMRKDGHQRRLSSAEDQHAGQRPATSDLPLPAEGLDDRTHEPRLGLRHHIPADG